VLPTP
jgi:hypothetical protein